MSKNDYQNKLKTLAEMTAKMQVLINDFRGMKKPLVTFKNPELEALKNVIFNANEAADYYDAISEACKTFIAAETGNFEQTRQYNDLARLQRFFYLLEKEKK